MEAVLEYPPNLNQNGSSNIKSQILEYVDVDCISSNNNISCTTNHHHLYYLLYLCLESLDNVDCISFRNTFPCITKKQSFACCTPKNSLLNPKTPTTNRAHCRPMRIWKPPRQLVKKCWTYYEYRSLFLCLLLMSKKKATVESQITLISTSLYSLLSNARKNLLENCADQSPNINANQ